MLNINKLGLGNYMHTITSIIFSILFATASVTWAQTTYQGVGNTIYTNQNRSYQQIANTTYGSDGSTYNRIGNTTYGNEGTTYQRYGSTTYGSDGTSAQQIGSTIYINLPGGRKTTCQRIGHQTICN